jgi:tripeptide aminopeptidase
MDRLKNTLVELLSIQGPSGAEGQVAAYVLGKLTELQIEAERDDFGNVLAQVSYGDGPTVLLSAHMDTVDDFEPDRRIVWDGQTIRSSAGILGADDRAGIAIILETLRRVRHAELRGTIKVAFTCAEEIGRIGSQHIAPEWLDGIEMAVVADRRNHRDIVTSCWRMPFCPAETGMFWVETARHIGQSGWAICQGGISDALTYAEYGIPSVNLSCGYLYEHTANEELYWPSVVDTTRLITAGLLRYMGVTSPVRGVLYT